MLAIYALAVVLASQLAVTPFPAVVSLPHGLGGTGLGREVLVIHVVYLSWGRNEIKIREQDQENRILGARAALPDESRHS